jgi:hypothetical protein
MTAEEIMNKVVIFVFGAIVHEMGDRLKKTLQTRKDEARADREREGPPREIGAGGGSLRGDLLREIGARHATDRELNALKVMVSERFAKLESDVEHLREDVGKLDSNGRIPAARASKSRPNF